MKKVFLLLVLLGLYASSSFAQKLDITTNYRNALIFAYSQANSSVEDENIRFEIYNEQLWATNLTSKTIFLDLAQCFINHNGSSTPLSDQSYKSQGDKKASKKGISTTFDEYIAIAPRTGENQAPTFICNMSTHIFGEYSTTESPTGDFTEYDKRLLQMVNDLVNESLKADPKRKQYYGTVSRHLTEDESINNIGASLAYSFNKKSEEWTNISLSTWVSDVIFAPYYNQLPRELKSKEIKGFGIKETNPAVVHVKADSPFEFDSDKSPILVCDWEGNFKKGTFILKNTYTAKKEKAITKLAAAIVLTPAILLVPLSDQIYKHVIQFDGASSNWGKMNYVSEITKTGTGVTGVKN